MCDSNDAVQRKALCAIYRERIMIITRTPFRLSFFGGGTDYPAFFREHGGAVLSTTFNKYCYITCRYLPPIFDHSLRIRYTEREEVSSIDAIRHPSVRECLRFLKIENGVEIVHTSDLPAMSGIGSSSSFTVGLLHALYAFKGEIVAKRKLAYEAISVEQDMVREHVGCQDQVAAAFGGFNKIEFSGENDISVQPVTVAKERMLELQECLLLCFTGFSRMSGEIAIEQIRRTPQKTRELIEIRSMVDDAISIINRKGTCLEDLGKLLHDSWMLKRELTCMITNNHIDQIYETARRSGALGGKLCGAGGGGFFLFFAPPEKHPIIKEALRELHFVPFRMETLGSHVVYYAQ